MPTAQTQCPQCGVSVDNDKIDLPHRCHRDCPLTATKLTAPQILRGEFTQVDLQNAKPAALDPILKAHANLIGYLCKLDVPKLHVNPTPEEFEEVRDYAENVIRVFDMWFKTVGDDVDSAFDRADQSQPVFGRVPRSDRRLGAR